MDLGSLLDSRGNEIWGGRHTEAEFTQSRTPTEARHGACPEAAEPPQDLSDASSLSSCHCLRRQLSRCPVASVSYFAAQLIGSKRM